MPTLFPHGFFSGRQEKQSIPRPLDIHLKLCHIWFLYTVLGKWWPEMIGSIQNWVHLYWRKTCPIWLYHPGMRFESHVSRAVPKHPLPPGLGWAPIANVLKLSFYLPHRTVLGQKLKLYETRKGLDRSENEGSLKGASEECKSLAHGHNSTFHYTTFIYMWTLKYGTERICRSIIDHR